MPKLSKAQWRAVTSLTAALHQAQHWIVEFACSCSKEERAREYGGHGEQCVGEQMADELYNLILDEVMATDIDDLLVTTDARLLLEDDQPEPEA